MTEEVKSPGPEDRIMGVRAAARRLLGAFTKGDYPDDKARKKKAGLVGVVASLISLVTYQTYDASAARKELVESQKALLATQAHLLTLQEKLVQNARDDFQASIKATNDTADAVRVLAGKIEAQNTLFLSKLPDQRPARAVVRFESAPAGLERR